MRFVRNLAALVLTILAVTTPIALTGNAVHAEVATNAIILQDNTDGGNWDP